jgi:hypothetical protein
MRVGTSKRKISEAVGSEMCKDAIISTRGTSAVG